MVQLKKGRRGRGGRDVGDLAEWMCNRNMDDLGCDCGRKYFVGSLWVSTNRYSPKRTCLSFFGGSVKEGVRGPVCCRLSLRTVGDHEMPALPHPHYVEDAKHTMASGRPVGRSGWWASCSSGMTLTCSSGRMGRDLMDAHGNFSES